MSGQSSTSTKSINLAIQQTGTSYTVPGDALTPGFGYLPGELYTQPGGKGAGPRTFTDGSVDIVVSP